MSIFCVATVHLDCSKMYQQVCVCVHICVYSSCLSVCHVCPCTDCMFFFNPKTWGGNANNGLNDFPGRNTKETGFTMSTNIVTSEQMSNQRPFQQSKSLPLNLHTWIGKWICPHVSDHSTQTELSYLLGCEMIFLEEEQFRECGPGIQLIFGENGY